MFPEQDSELLVLWATYGSSGAHIFALCGAMYNWEEQGKAGHGRPRPPRRCFFNYGINSFTNSRPRQSSRIRPAQANGQSFVLQTALFDQHCFSGRIQNAFLASVFLQILKLPGPSGLADRVSWRARPSTTTRAARTLYAQWKALLFVPC